MRNSRGRDLLIVGLIFVPTVPLSVDISGKAAIVAIAKDQHKAELTGSALGCFGDALIFVQRILSSSLI